MFRSLRAKLVASYGVVILLCLLVVGSGSVYFLREYQREIKLNQLSDLAPPLSWQVRLLERAGASREQIGQFLQERALEMDVRILLVDSSGLVVNDTGGTLSGDRLQLPGNWASTERYISFTTVVTGHSDNQGFVFISSPGRPPSPNLERFAVRVPTNAVVLAIPQQSLTAGWLELAPSLGLAALVSLIVSVAVAWLLSRSISRPITQMTKASEEMARGNYNQYIPVRTRDEVGRLAETFNHMAHQVSTSNRTLRDFLANVSHELRTPLTSIQGFSQAMVDGTVRSANDYTEAAQIINEEADRMRQLVEDLLLLSKLESGQMPMEQSALDLRELLRASIRRTAVQAQQLGVTLRFEADGAFPFDGDERRLEQVFRNLLDNALHHTPRDGAITVRLSAKDGVGRVRVHNTGSYIPPADQERIFERFYQVDKSRAHDGDGSGLGLAIASEIVHAHGGKISVQSTPDEGTTFILDFHGQRSA